MRASTMGIAACLVVTACGKSAKEREEAAEAPSPIAAPPDGGQLSAADRGKKLFEGKGCVSCHTIDGSARIGAPLDGVWGQPIALADGTSPVFDEAFLRKALDEPQKFMRSGFPPTMPSYQGQLSDADVADLGAFLATLR